MRSPDCGRIDTRHTDSDGGDDRALWGCVAGLMLEMRAPSRFGTDAGLAEGATMATRVRPKESRVRSVNDGCGIAAGQAAKVWTARLTTELV